MPLHLALTGLCLSLAGTYMGNIVTDGIGGAFYVMPLWAGAFACSMIGLVRVLGDRTLVCSSFQKVAVLVVCLTNLALGLGLILSHV